MVTQPSKSNWRTQHITLQGGMILNQGPIEQGSQSPGSLINAVNFEACMQGGYQRIQGTARYDTHVVPSSGQILGTFVFNGGVVAMRGTKVYFSTGSGWSDITGNARTGAGKYRACRFNFVKPSIIFCDGVNTPAAYYSDGTYKDITAAPAAQNFVTQFNNNIFLASKTSSNLTFSAPADETDWNALDGAGQINVGFPVTGGMAVWRDALYVFGEKNIVAIKGQNATNFTVVPVTGNIGNIAPDSLQEVGGDLVFLAPDGIRTVAGTMRLDDVDLSNLSRTIQPQIISLINMYRSGNVSSCVIRGKSQYRLFPSVSGIPSSSPSGIIGSLRLGLDGSVGWEWFNSSGFNVYCADDDYNSITGLEQIVHANFDATDNYVYIQEAGVNAQFVDKTNASVQIPWLLQLANNPFDDSALRKTLYRIVGYFGADGPVTIYANVVLDLNDSTVIQPASILLANLIGPAVYDLISNYDDPTVVYDATDLFKAQSPAVGSGKTFSIGVAGTGGSAFVLRSLYVEYALHGRN